MSEAFATSRTIPEEPATGVRVGVLSLHNSKETKAICNAIEDLGHEPEWLRRENFAVSIRDGETTLEPDVDAIVNRLLLTNTEQPMEGLGLAATLESLRPTLNPPAATMRSIHKFATAATLAEAGIPVPDALLALSTERLNRDRDAFGEEAVYKTAIGTHGGGTWKVDFEEPINPQVGHRYAFLQALIESEERPQDRRVYVVGDEIRGAMTRHAPEGDWRTNVALGGNVEFFISGGGSLSAELCALYHGMGLPILEGYGLTETSPVISVNPPERPQVGTIGPPVPDTEVRVDESIASPQQRDRADGDVGELLVRGPQVFDGYWGLEDATERAFTELDGQEWFRTGDVVEIRDDDYVRFLERAKQILTLSTGKNVAPGPIEDAFAASPLVEQAMVVGNNRKFVSAVIVPNFGGVRKWADTEDVDIPDDKAAMCRDDRVEARIQEEVDDVNDDLEDYEQIKQFRLVPTEFTEENDLLTPTMKKKRRNIIDVHDELIDDIYAE